MKPYRLLDLSLVDSAEVLARREFDDINEALAAFKAAADHAERNGGDVRLRGPDGVIESVRHWGPSE